MKFVDSATNQAHRFSIGREEHSGQFYLSIPVSNQFADYEEYYKITPEQFAAYPENESELLEFAEQCRQQKNDERLLQKPNRDRGVAI